MIAILHCPLLPDVEPELIPEGDYCYYEVSHEFAVVQGPPMPSQADAIEAWNAMMTIPERTCVWRELHAAVEAVDTNERDALRAEVGRLRDIADELLLLAERNLATAFPDVVRYWRAVLEGTEKFPT